MPEDDVAFLDAQGWMWEAALIDGTQWLLVHAFPVPAALTSSHVTLAVRIVPGYPAAALDMVYVRPPLARTDGRAIRAVTPCVIEGDGFQQWSRHYSASHPWRPDIDGIASHLHAAEEWLRSAAS